MKESTNSEVQNCCHCLGLELSGKDEGQAVRDSLSQPWGSLLRRQASEPFGDNQGSCALRLV